MQVTTAVAGHLLEQAPADTEYEASSFTALKLSRPLLKACTELGYTVPTAVQVRSRAFSRFMPRWYLQLANSVVDESNLYREAA